ncbi:MAG: hypothetical protein RIC35_01825 [Marinoscillum sp.]
MLISEKEIKLIERQLRALWSEFSTRYCSVKETFKLQFPITGQGMEYDDMEVFFVNDQLYVQSKMKLKKNLHEKPIRIRFFIRCDYLVCFAGFS